jgi:hypothetical protein
MLAPAFILALAETRAVALEDARKRRALPSPAKDDKERSIRATANFIAGNLSIGFQRKLDRLYRKIHQA